MSYTILLTDDAGKRYYGFTRRFATKNDPFPECLCFISELYVTTALHFHQIFHSPWFEFFREILLVAQTRYLHSWNAFVSFASALRNYPMPASGSFSITCPPEASLQTNYTLTVPNDNLVPVGEVTYPFP